MVLTKTDLKGLKKLFSGKVRDVYDVDERHVLIVTTDRISAFDVVMPQGIPLKGTVLHLITDFWLQRFARIVPNHTSLRALSDVIKDPRELELLKNRAVIVRKAKPLMMECVVRGYLMGSGYKDYQATGTLCGHRLPAGLKLAQKLPQPLFTPATKAAVGEHDENISFEEACESVGKDLARQARDASLKLYEAAAQHALPRGIIIADTKFEFGLIDGKLRLIDEVLTPDSSRFWSVKDYRVGISPPSYDKQIVRDYLETLSWNKKAPGPNLPTEIIEKASRRYQEIYEILTGCHLESAAGG